MAERSPQWIADSRLWLVLDREAAKPLSLPEATRRCIEGGVDVVVFRMKDATGAEALPVAIEVREVCRRMECPFVLAHFIDWAQPLYPKRVRPDAIHLGRSDDGSMLDRYPENKWYPLGWSAHSVEEVSALIGEGPDYAFLGPIFDTPSKRAYGQPLGTQVISQVDKVQSWYRRRKFPEFPVVYIGGMNEQSIPLAVAAGAKRVAAISALLSVPDPKAAAAKLRRLLPD